LRPYTEPDGYITLAHLEQMLAGAPG